MPRTTSSQILSLVVFLLLTTKQVWAESDDLDAVQQIVAAGHGVEIYNVGKQQQISFFLSHRQHKGHPDHQKWLSYYLPRLHNAGKKKNRYLKAGEFRESCAIEGMPVIHPDGTIYIACAGGVLNKLTPHKTGYRHDYWIIDGTDKLNRPLLPQTNSGRARRMAVDNQVVYQPAVWPVKSGKAQKSASWFEHFKNRQKQSSYNLLRQKGIATSDEFHEAYSVKAKYGMTLDQGMQLLANGKYDHPLVTPPKFKLQSSDILGAMKEKDGPLKELAKLYWGRNKALITDIKDARKQADRLMPGLSRYWTDELLTKTDAEGRTTFKYNAERLPVFKVRIARIPENNSEFFVSVLDHLYRLNHTTGKLVRIGKASQESSGVPDSTGLIALDNKTALISSMGTGDSDNTRSTLQVLRQTHPANAAQYAPELSAAVTESLAPLWNNKQQPRIKGMFAASDTRHSDICSRPGETSLFIRTKHAGNDLVHACIRNSGDNLMVLQRQALHLSSHYNVQYLAAAGNTLFRSPEPEDILRDQSMWQYGNLTEFKHDRIGTYKLTQSSKAATQQDAVPAFKALPDYLRYGAYGLNGIAVLNR